MLVQNEPFLEENAQHIVDIEKSVQRLSRLHQSLLLLTKVENKQFILNEEVSLKNIILDKCAEYSEMAEGMKLVLNTELEQGKILFHQHLAEILINNLLGNAIKYNKRGGSIDIQLKNGQLRLSNTSVNGSLDEQKIFKRFYRNNSSTEGNGLGLSIVKQICDMGSHSIKYEYENEPAYFYYYIKLTCKIHTEFVCCFVMMKYLDSHTPPYLRLITAVIVIVIFLFSNQLNAQNKSLDYYLIQGIANNPIIKDFNNQISSIILIASACMPLSNHR